MRNIAWAVLLISALTDFIITFGTAIMTANAATGQYEIPNKAVILWALMGGMVAAARTIQQALKTIISPEVNQTLK